MRRMVYTTLRFFRVCFSHLRGESKKQQLVRNTLTGVAELQLYRSVVDKDGYPLHTFHNHPVQTTKGDISCILGVCRRCDLSV